MGLISKIAGKVGKVFNDITGVTQQNEYNMQMWKMQNEYNSPAEQMKRYREAGLNPNLIYGNGSSSAGNATSAPQMESYQNGFQRTMNFLSSLYSMKNLKAQNNNLNAQTDQIKEDTRLKGITVDLRQKELELKAKELDILERTGMHPGVGSAILDIGGRLVDAITGKPMTPTGRAESVGTAVRNAYEAGFPSVAGGYEYFGRGHDMAVKAANKRGLTGKAREQYIRKVEEIYARAH